MKNTGAESTGPPATSGGGGAGLRPAGAAAGQGREQRLAEAGQRAYPVVVPAVDVVAGGA
jgi:hypothetical protein